MNKNNTEKLSFEEALEKLEKIVSLLEGEDVPLEKMINYYQNGMELSKMCNDMLQDAEEKMTRILNENNQLESFQIEEEM